MTRILERRRDTLLLAAVNLMLFAACANPATTPPVGVTPPPATNPAPLAERGLRASYFNTEDLSGSSVTRLEPTVNFEWGTGAPDGVNPDRFSARFEGSLEPRHSEVYSFIVHADDGVRLWVNGVKLMDRWEYAPHTDHARLKLEAGKRYAIKLEYHEGIVGATLRLEWQSASQAREVIPNEALSPEAGVAEGLPENAPLRVLADARGIRLGSEIAAADHAKDAQLREVLAREFNHVQPGSECMAVNTHTESDPMRLKLNGDNRLEPFDTLLDAARGNAQSVQCFHLIWYIEAVWGPWLARLSVEERRTFMANRLRDMIARYRGKVEAWNVVNEAFDDDGTTREREFRMDDKTNLNWVYDLGSGTEYIEQAFRWARDADANAKLFYNDYGMEWGNAGYPNPKWNGVLNMLRDFHARGVPMDGVGFQAHLSVAWGPSPSLIDPEAFAADLAGHFREVHAVNPRLETRITELDVNIGEPSSVPEAQRLQLQARLFGSLTRACLNAPNCTGLSTWGVSDKYSWITQPYWNGKPENKPLMFDENFQPKPAYYAVRDALLGR